MAQADLANVWAIEQTLVGAWTQPLLKEEFALPHGWRFIAKSGDVLLGYIFGVIIADEAEIRKLAVAANYRRQGIAGILITAALRYLADHKAATCFLEVRQNNRAALNLYRQFGFQQIGIRKSYYTSPSDNAIIFRKDIVYAFTSTKMADSKLNGPFSD